MAAVYEYGEFFIRYKAEIHRFPWWPDQTLKSVSDHYRDWMGHSGELVFYMDAEKNKVGQILTGDALPQKGATYLARDCGSNPCVTMEETETYISPFSGKRV